MRRTHVIEVLRWLAVIPVAKGAAAIGYSLGLDLFHRPMTSGLLGNLLTLLILLPSGLAFTLGGGCTAPRWKILTASVLTVYWLQFSLVRHIFGQVHPTIDMKLHAAGECLGAVIGLAIICYQTWQMHVEQQPSEELESETTE